MNNSLSVFDRIVVKLGKLHPARPASMVGVPPIPSVFTGVKGISTRIGTSPNSLRLQKKWKIHGDAAQTPSNMM